MSCISEIAHPKTLHQYFLILLEVNRFEESGREVKATGIRRFFHINSKNYKDVDSISTD